MGNVIQWFKVHELLGARGDETPIDAVCRVKRERDELRKRIEDCEKQLTDASKNANKLVQEIQRLNREVASLHPPATLYGIPFNDWIDLHGKLLERTGEADPLKAWKQIEHVLNLKASIGFIGSTQPGLELRIAELKETIKVQEGQIEFYQRELTGAMNTIAELEIEAADLREDRLKLCQEVMAGKPDPKPNKEGIEHAARVAAQKICNESNVGLLGSKWIGTHRITEIIKGEFGATQ